MPKKLALHQGERDRPTVDRHERLAHAFTPVVYRPGDQFLSGSTLSVDQDGSVGFRHPFHLEHDLPQSAFLADDTGVHIS